MSSDDQFLIPEDDTSVTYLMTTHYGSDDPVVERHLSEMKAAYADLDWNAEAAMEVDAAIAEADAELGLSEHESFITAAIETDRFRSSPHTDLKPSPQEGGSEPVVNKTRARKKNVTRPRHPRRTRSLIRTSAARFATLAALSALMVTGSVLLGIFGNEGLGVILSAPVAIAIISHSALMTYLGARGARESGALATLRAMHQQDRHP